jgi:hypothetical protein
LQIAKSNEALTLKEIEDNKQKALEQNKEYTKNENRRFKAIEDNNRDIEKSNELKRKAQEDLEQEEGKYEAFKNKFAYEKNHLFKKAENNDIMLAEQKEKEKEMKDKIANLQKDFDELDADYQQLLEKYIITT